MTGFLTRGWGTSRLLEAEIQQTQLDATSNTTLANIPNLAHKLNGGMKYVFQAHLTVTSDASGGVKVALLGDGGLTATQFKATAQNYNGTTLNALTTTTTLGSVIGAATAVATDIYITGSLIVNKPGVLRVQFAQNASNATVSSALVGSAIQFFNAF